jgi:RNA polymerase sigma-70 factor (ECF subfamily)
MSMNLSPAQRPDSDLSFAYLLALARQGSQAALGQILEHCRPYLLLVANQEVPTDLQGKIGPSDLVQESLFRASQKYAAFQGETEAELRGWLRRILLNKIVDQTRHFRSTGNRAVDREIEWANVPADELTRSLANDESPSAQLMLAEQLEQLQQALERLPDACRQLIQWRNYERLTFKEIGNRLGLTAEAARKAWARAIEQVQMPGMDHEW